MTTTPERLYKAHVGNLRSLEKGLRFTYLASKQALSKQQDAAADAHLRVFLMLIGAWLECRLRKLLFEPNGLDASLRNRVTGNESSPQLERWNEALRIGFARRYLSDPKNLPTEHNLPHTEWLRFNSLSVKLNDDLSHIITMRNKLAHGQWERTLNSNQDDFEKSQMAALNAETVLSAHFKYKTAKVLANLIHDLICSSAAFPRDFDAHYEAIKHISQNSKSLNYSDWRQRLVEKRRNSVHP